MLSVYVLYKYNYINGDIALSKKPNKHIIEYLKWYISDKCKNPGFAILLKGGWGSGKTWFVEEFISKNGKNSSSDSKFIYISLFGLESTEDINNLIFQDLHPKLSSEAVKITGKLAKSVLSKFVSELPDIDLQMYLNKFEDKVLVFDDFERCNIKLEKVFGYINGFIEHQSKKVIVVANDEEIESGLEEDKKKEGPKYHLVREKVIGKTFKIETDIPTVIKSLIKENAPKSKKLLSSHEDLLVNIFETVREKAGKEQANYRAFSHTIKDFEYLWVKINKKYKKHAEFEKDFLNVFIRMGYELQLGLIKDKDVSNIGRARSERMYASIRNNNTNEEQKENEYKDIEDFFDRHNLNFDNLMIPYDVWFQILCENNIDLSSIEESFNNSSYFIDESQPDWVKLWHYYDLDDDDSEGVIDLIVKNLDEFSYENLGEIFHIYGALLRRCEDGVVLPNEIGNTPQEIEEHAKKYIDYLYDNDRLPKRKDIAKQYMTSAYGYFGYSSLDSDNFTNIRNYFLERCNERLGVLTPTRIKEILDCMGSDTRKFHGLIASQDFNCDNDKPSYWNVAIFQNFDPKDFFDSYKKIPNSNKRFLDDIFKERYRPLDNCHLSMVAEFREFPVELDFMNQLLELVDQAITDAPTGSPSIWHMKLLRDEGLKFAIDRLEQFKRDVESAESSSEGETN